MVLFQSLVIQEKEVFLKKNKVYFLIYILIFFIFSGQSFSNSEEFEIKKELFKYLSNNSEISSNFIQASDDLLQEGIFYLKNNRLRIEYADPEIIIIVKKNNAMYYNVDLQEVQYFNPKNTVAEFFFNLFYDPSFLDNVKFDFQNRSFSLTKIYEIEDEKSVIKVHFEKSPLKIRKIELTNSSGKILFGITDLNYNPNLDDNLFSLANPLLS